MLRFACRQVKLGFVASLLASPTGSERDCLLRDSQRTRAMNRTLRKQFGPQLRGPSRERCFGWGSDCSRALTNRLASSRPRIRAIFYQALAATAPRQFP
jgi:hypothetical protein